MAIEDDTAIAELQAMARVYQEHGDDERAGRVLKLAEEMKQRLRRGRKLQEIQEIESSLQDSDEQKQA